MFFIPAAGGESYVSLDGLFCFTPDMNFAGWVILLFGKTSKKQQRNKQKTP